MFIRLKRVNARKVRTSPFAKEAKGKMAVGNAHHPACKSAGRESGTETILVKWFVGGNADKLFIKGEKCMEVLDLESKATMLSALKGDGVPSPA